ncbi:MAG: carboxylesterase family protein [Alphaproteobacteria bacterium]|nr:carboxylesterase family protein [Alphaproteobacteria bacterium]
MVFILRSFVNSRVALSLGTVRVTITAVALIHLAGTVDAQPVVNTPLGKLHGTIRSGIDRFLGIPFAQAPIGYLRWRAPVPVKSWKGIREATVAAPACYQPAAKPFGPYTSEFLIGPDISEDCLYLNVWKPAHVHARVPVLFFIHGGGFGSGSGSIPIYDGSSLARHGVVVVTINYRLGVFGFLATPELTRESGKGTSGNFGLLDQIAALQWVKNNIAAFGGDPHHITIAGQSAGAASVSDLIASPMARGLFQRAIAESGSGMGIEMPTLGEAESVGQNLLARAGVNSAAQLRALSPEAVLNAAASLTPPKPGAMPTIIFVPNRDGVVISGDPEDGAAPIQSPVPFITGFNADEGMPPPRMNVASAFEMMVHARYGSSADRMLALYPHGNDKEASESWATLARDRYMASLTIWAQERAKSSRQPVYTYLFTHPYPGRGWDGTPSAFHTAEVPYVFGTVDRSGSHLTQADRAVESRMQSVWITFVLSGKPIVPHQNWPVAGRESTNVMTLGQTARMQPAVSNKERFEALRAYAAAGGKLSLF